MTVEITGDVTTLVVDDKPITFRFFDDTGKETFCIALMPALLEKYLMATVSDKQKKSRWVKA